MRRRTRRRVRVIGLAIAGLAGFLGAGCGGREEAPSKEAAPVAAPATVPPLVDSRGRQAPVSPDAGGAPSREGELTWTTPQGWVTEAPASSMRKAQYALPRASGDSEDGQCAVFYFGPGQGGDVGANVDRWASQFTTPSGGHPKPLVTEGTVAGRKVLKVMMEGTYAPSPMMGGSAEPKSGTLLLGAIVEGPDANWFFKCTGPKKTMESRRKEFDALIGSIHAP
jgi:hypothetical protein